MSDIKSIKRAVEILNLYTVGTVELGPTEAARNLGINKVSVIRLMSTLASVNLLIKSTDSRKYRLNSKIMELAQTFVLNADLCTIALPHIEKLREKTGETIATYVLKGDERECVAESMSYQHIQHQCKVGERAPLHAGSPGKLLLAYLPDKKIDEIIQRTGLPLYTDHTITNKKELKKEIEHIRRQGVAVSKGEHEEYAYGVSAPIRNYRGLVIASLSVVGVIMRFNLEKEREFSKLLKEAASKISLELGYWNIEQNKS